MVTKFVTERAIAPRDGSVSSVVIDDGHEVHNEASAYLEWLCSSDRSPNTERVYAGRIAYFLTYCARARLDWRTVTVDDLTRFLHDLVLDSAAFVTDNLTAQIAAFEQVAKVMRENLNTSTPRNVCASRCSDHTAKSVGRHTAAAHSRILYETGEHG